MLKTTCAMGALAAAIATAAFASEATVDPSVKTAITDVLAAQGYAVGEIEAEDGAFEAYADKDGETFEIYLDADYKILRVESEDDDD